MLKLIYITGYGRSGSTILDILLGQHEEIFGMGELSTMCRHVWLNNEYCACGARIQACAVWASVMSDWLSNGIEIKEHLALQKQVEPLYRRFAGPETPVCDATWHKPKPCSKLPLDTRERRY
jgi:hypothetical protein